MTPTSETEADAAFLHWSDTPVTRGGTFLIDRLTHANEVRANIAFFNMQLIRDELMWANEGNAAELVESAIQALQDACRVLLGRRAA